MIYRYWSFDGRISRGAFWLGMLFVNMLMIGAFALLLSLPTLESWMALAVIPLFLFFAVAMYALQVQRLHDLGQSANVLWSPFHGFRWVWAMGFAAGEKGGNKYGAPPPPNRTASWLVLALVAGALLTASSLFFTSGFECRDSVSATGSTEEEADELWHHKVERLHGSRFGDSGIKMLSVTTCLNETCSASARPCAFAE